MQLLRRARRRQGLRRAHGGSIIETSWCLFLDVDGTLLEFADTPGAVQVDAALTGLMSRLARALDGALALVSGRSIAELDRLFAPRRWPAAGVHGLERRDADGHWSVQRSLDADALDRAREPLRRLVERTPGTLLEDKGLSLALHFRRARESGPGICAAVEAFAQAGKGRLVAVHGVDMIELRPAGATKADAIRAFLREPPFAGRRPVFLGDDVTDQAALHQVALAGGLAVAVGPRVVAPRRLDGPGTVREFLEAMADQGRPPP